MRYVAFVHDNGSRGSRTFGISFPDFPGCVSAGDTPQAAVLHGAEALAFHIEGMVDDGEPIPAPTSWKDIEGSSDFPMRGDSPSRSLAEGSAEWARDADIILLPAVTSFVLGLARMPAGALFNPWFQRDACHDAAEDAPGVRRRQLVHYLASRIERARYLLIAEAPGYNGAHFSGIAMTSERILLGHSCIRPADVLPCLQPERTSKPELKPRGFTERTATTVWRTLRHFGMRPLDVVLWNAVPWHPYREREGLLSNRTPTPNERSAALAHLRDFLELFPRAHPIAVGRVSERLLSECDRDFSYARHPSFGGKAEFGAGIKAVLRVG